MANRIYNTVANEGYCVIYMDSRSMPVFENQLSLKYGAYYYCTEGEATVQINMKNHRIRKGDFCISTSTSICSVIKVSDDFQLFAVMVSRDISANAGSGLSTELLTSIIKYPVISPYDENQRQYLCNLLKNVELLDKIFSNRRELAFIEALVLSLRAFLRMFAKIIAWQYSCDNEYSFSASDGHFRNFIELMEVHIQTEHEVSFYAGKMSITPKYLNELARRKTQHTAKEMISSFLANKIKRDLLMSGKSLKCLAAEYNFSDQSSFGKFFKKATGVSPITFRQTQGIAESQS